MTPATQQDQLETVSAMAAALADRMLMGRLTGDPPSTAKAETLWMASLLLEEKEQPVPFIVTEVLSQFRPAEDAYRSEPVRRRDPYRDSPLTRVLARLFPSFQATASAGLDG